MYVFSLRIPLVLALIFTVLVDWAVKPKLLTSGSVHKTAVWFRFFPSLNTCCLVPTVKADSTLPETFQVYMDRTITSTTNSFVSWHYMSSPGLCIHPTVMCQLMPLCCIRLQICLECRKHLQAACLSWSTTVVHTATHFNVVHTVTHFNVIHTVTHFNWKLTK